MVGACLREQQDRSVSEGTAWQRPSRCRVEQHPSVAEDIGGFGSPEIQQENLRFPSSS